MELSWAVIFVVAQQCAPAIHWETMSALIDVESKSEQWAINDNRSKKRYSPKSLEEAVNIAEQLISEGRSVDLGLAQVNSANLPKLGISVADAFNTCKNLAAAQTVLNGNYRRAMASGYAYGQPALQAALSAYNTGSFTRGRTYVAKFLKAAKSPFPLQPFLTAPTT